MRNSWFFFMDLDGGSPYIFPTEPPVSHSFGGHLLSQISSIVDSSLYQSRYLYVPGSLALQEALNCISKFVGALFWFSCGSNSNLNRKLSGNPHGSKPRSCKSCTQVKHIISCRNNLARLHFRSKSKGESAIPIGFSKFVSSTMRHLFKEAELLQSFPVLSLASALIPPFDSLSPKVLSAPREHVDVQIHGHMDQIPCEDKSGGCGGLSFPDINWTRHAVEPRTGIKFPTVLDNIFAGANNSNLISEVLVGTGFRSMKIIKIKSLKVYAFGLYIHPNSICEKLGPKYASVPVNELNNRPDFFEDLLREDIHMTVRLVVNCNGLKISTVREAFEKSLRARLLKTNPDTDYHCLKAFGSCFTQDIPLPVGTTIDIQQTADGQLITDIGSKRIGVVHSKDLCRAFFDMYVGSVPVSVQAKEEIGRNIASILRSCLRVLDGDELGRALRKFAQLPLGCYSIDGGKGSMAKLLPVEMEGAVATQVAVLWRLNGGRSIDFMEVQGMRLSRREKIGEIMR
ncbi:hypothetical protein HHK36_014395 [Tetracentron sinense]|uniref:Chalcone isomerase domain-containing protein n=1 Tax=Tetracentron sinense TaxID=13715 RepID=A0A834ZEQ4_TETSI|nr:hypothetical protein HHK36_014395 [Tetracentron sinense]